MSNTNPVLVIYKNKILLITSDFPQEQSQLTWSLIGEDSVWSKSVGGDVHKALKQIIKLNLINITKLEIPDLKRDLFYVKLTDKNVNNIVRREGQRLEFYGLNELQKLNLSQMAAHVFTSCKDQVSSLLTG